jgi:hypothetical protein
MAQDPTNARQYFASLPPDELIRALHGKIEAFYQDLLDTGVFTIWEKSWRAYYGAKLTGGPSGGQLFDSTDLTRSGKKGEIVNFKINHYRSLIKHTIQLATANKPAYACKATNSDTKSQTQAGFGNGLLDYYLREKKLQRVFIDALERFMVFSEGWVHCPWNAQIGEMIAVHPETGAPIFEGDMEFSVHTPLDVVRDITLGDQDKHVWRLLRRRRNKYELAAQRPELAERILTLNSADVEKYAQLASFNLNVRGRDLDSDYLTSWILYHEKTDAMPEGRMFEFVGDVELFDGPIPYRRVPLHLMRAENLMETAYGYSPAFDILGPQQALDILNSTILTNQASFGVQSIWTKNQDPVTVTQLEGGMKNLQSDEMPQALQLVKTAPEIFQYRQEVVGEMETLIGVSATVRGNPEANLKSGAALALVVSQSIQFASLIEGAYNALFEDVGSDVITQLRDFSKSERVANIIGEANRPYQKKFTGDDLSEINRVQVEAASALSKTVAGRVEIANQLMSQGLIETPKQYIQVLTTGTLDPAIEGVQHELMNIRAENEALRAGQKVVALITDRHEDHVREHAYLLANPESRRDPKLVQSVLAHIQEHVAQWRGADPAILMITKQNPPPPPPGMLPPGAPPPGPGGAPAPGAPAGGTPPGPGMLQPQKPGQEQLPSPPNMPSLPEGAPPQAQAALDKIA